MAFLIPIHHWIKFILFQVICSALPEGQFNATTCSSSGGFQRLTSLLYVDFGSVSSPYHNRSYFLNRNSVTRVDIKSVISISEMKRLENIAPRRIKMIKQWQFALIWSYDVNQNIYLVLHCMIFCFQEKRNRIWHKKHLIDQIMEA